MAVGLRWRADSSQPEEITGNVASTSPSFDVWPAKTVLRIRLGLKLCATGLSAGTGAGVTPEARTSLGPRPSSGGPAADLRNFRNGCGSRMRLTWRTFTPISHSLQSKPLRGAYPMKATPAALGRRTARSARSAASPSQLCKRARLQPALGTFSIGTIVSVDSRSSLFSGRK
jgi:hypothetical protein